MIGFFCQLSSQSLASFVNTTLQMEQWKERLTGQESALDIQDGDFSCAIQS